MLLLDHVAQRALIALHAVRSGATSSIPGEWVAFVVKKYDDGARKLEVTDNNTFLYIF